MRKKIITRPGGLSGPPAPISAEEWLDIESLAWVEVTSERDGFPIENALLPPGESPWRAAHPGSQTIRLIFDHP